jgi:hypothetical protein
MALCIVRDGQVIGRCIDPPRNRYLRRYQSIELLNWAIEMITDEKRSNKAPIKRQDILMLKSGRFTVLNIYDGITFAVTFSLPPILLKAIDEIESGRGNMFGNENENDIVLS